MIVFSSITSQSYRAFFNFSYCQLKILKTVKTVLEILGSHFSNLNTEIKSSLNEVEKGLSSAIFVIETLCLPQKIEKCYKALDSALKNFKKIDANSNAYSSLKGIVKAISLLIKGIYLLISSINKMFFKPIYFYAKYFPVNETIKSIGKHYKTIQFCSHVFKIAYYVSDLIGNKFRIKRLIDLAITITTFVITILAMCHVAIPATLIVTVACLTISVNGYKALDKAKKMIL